MSATVNIGGHEVFSFRLALPLLGVGSLEAEIDLEPGATPPSGTVTLTIAAEGRAPAAYLVTILPSIGGDDAGREAIGRHKLFAVQGTGSLRARIAGIDYADVLPRLIAEDLLSLEASDLSALSSLPPLPRWSRPAGTVRAAFSRLAERLGMGWRVAPAGAVTLAPETWPAYATTAPVYTREPDASGVGELALDAADLLPGMTILRPDGRPGDPFRVAEIVYSLAGGAFRAQIRVQLPDGGDGPSLVEWRRAVGVALPPLRLYVPHSATVVDQDPTTGALGLRLDGRDPPMLTLSAVPLWLGLPGRQVLIPLGARVLVHFAGGSEETPVVLGHEWAGGFTLERIGDNQNPLAVQGDGVDCGWFTIGPGPAYALAPAPPGAPGAVQITGSIASGSAAEGRVVG